MGDSVSMSKDALKDKMLLFGCGNMAGAMLAGWLAGGTEPSSFTILDPAADNLPKGVKVVRDAGELSGKFDCLMLGVKPQMLDNVAEQVLGATNSGAIIISILAGVETEQLQAKLPDRKILRLMPNLSAALGLSPMGLWAPQLTSAERGSVDKLLAPLGSPEWLEGEEQMDAFTALAGSGPAFVFRFIDALAAGGVATGLPEEQAQRIAMQMVLGAAQLADSSPDSPGALAQRVASPGGTTAAGLDILDENGALASLTKNTLRAARDRGAELARQAKDDT